MATLLPGNIVYAGPLTCSESNAYRSLGHLILEKYKSFGHQIVMIDAVSGREYSAKYMYDSIVQLAYCLQDLGVKSGDVVAISCENSVEFAIILFACFALNATVSPLNITYSERELHHAINLSRPVVIFASKKTTDIAVRVANSKSFVKIVVTLGTVNPSSKVLTFKNLMQERNIKSSCDFHPPAANKLEDVALIVCSSGTTGHPKGVQLTQGNILTTLDRKIAPSALSLSNIPLLTVIPWFHSYGCVTLIITAAMGTTLVFLPRFDENLFLGAIEKYRILMAFMVPPLMVFLAKHPIVDKYNLSSLMVLLCGAAPLSKETEDQIKERIGVPIIRQGYGLSESTLTLLVQTDELCKPGSVGSLQLGLYAKVIDPETGKALGPNMRGELCFKGDCIMKGYIGDAGSTQTTIRDGWLHTGDIGYFDEDFEFFIVDRIKELIKYKGFQVPPAELEALLLTHRKIKDVAVVGKPDEEAGELPMAFVVKQANAELSEKDVKEFVAKRASPAKKLRGGVVFVDDIPKNPSGKILRRVLRDMIGKQQKSKL